MNGKRIEQGQFNNRKLIKEEQIMGSLPLDGFSDVMFTIVPIIIVIIFVIVFGTIIVGSVQGAKRWKRNNASPVLTVDATIVTKRIDVHHNSQNAGTDNINHMSTSTIYYVTFEVASGDRLGFKIRDIEYGKLVEKDLGKLTFQGSRYLGFERDRS